MRLGARPAATRRDLLRRTGARGEIATVEERLERVVWLLSRRRRLAHWTSLTWHVEQFRRQVVRLQTHRPTPATWRVLLELCDGLDRLHDELDADLTELRAEADGAARHLTSAVSALNVDLELADQFRLHEHVLVAALGVERGMEQSA